MKVNSVLRNLLLLGLVVGVLSGCRDNSKYRQPTNTESTPTPTPTPTPEGPTAAGVTITGKMIWHSYAQYGFTGVQSWMANFDAGTVTEITPANVDGAMNYHFNNDGSEVVFMGSDHSASTQAWDIWVANVTDAGLTNVTKITAGSTDQSRNEDPKFSSDGTKIIFKKDLNNIYSIDTADITLNGTDQTPAETLVLANGYESSMPYYMVGSDTDFVFTNDTNPQQGTIQYSSGGQVTTLYAPASGSEAYYPIALDATKFYFTQSNLVGHDQIFLGDTSASPAKGAAFNNGAYAIADPYPMDPNWLAYSSAAPGGTGGKDIWIGNFTTGETYNLNDWIPGANQANDDLGPTFFGTISGGIGGSGDGGIPGGGVNLASNQPASAYTASSTYDDSHTPADAIGGNPKSFWSPTDGTFPAWWMVDLGDNYFVSQVSLTFHPSTDPDVWHFIIEGSTDGTTFTTLNDQSANTDSITGGTYSTGNAVVRYIRVTFTSATANQNWAGLENVVINGLSAASTSVLSLNMPATVSTDDGTHLASMVNDGDPTTVWGAKDGSFPQWWMVDLGSTHLLTEVDVTFRPADTWQFQIQTSTDGSNFTTVVDQSGNTSSMATGTYPVDNVAARYVRVYITGDPGGNWAVLSDVTVTGY